MTDLRKITERLDAPELLTQLAEEAGELVQAALKLRRALTCINPTPVPASKALTDLMEEIADVDNVRALLVYSLNLNLSTICEIGDRKMHRWMERLEAHHGQK